MNTIKKLRKKRNLTQAELSEKINLSQSAVAKWENGECMPKAEMLPKLAKILNCSIDELFDKAE